MSITVRIPTPLQKLTQNQSEISCDASDIDGLGRRRKAVDAVTGGNRYGPCMRGGVIQCVLVADAVERVRPDAIHR